MSDPEIEIISKKATVKEIVDRQFHWSAVLDDDTAIPIPRLFDAPPIGTELEIHLMPYRLDAAMDPHGDPRYRVIRVVWGPVTIHAAEYDELLQERDTLRMALQSEREGRTAQPVSPWDSIVQRVRAAADALFQPPAPSVPPSEGPFPGGTPPWAGPPGGDQSGPGSPGV